MIANKLKTRYHFLVRHGERCDLDPKLAAQYKGHPDAPLTDRGFEQATEAGAYL